MGFTFSSIKNEEPYRLLTEEELRYKRLKSGLDCTERLGNFGHFFFRSWKACLLGCEKAHDAAEFKFNREMSRRESWLEQAIASSSSQL